MATFRLSPLAVRDLEDIWLYTVQHRSVGQADSYIADLVAAFEQLAAGKRVGQVVTIRQGYLKHSVGSHVVFLRALHEWCDVIRVLHSRMDFERHL